MNSRHNKIYLKAYVTTINFVQLRHNHGKNKKMNQSEAQSRTESIWKLLRVYFKETTVCVPFKKRKATACVTLGFRRSVNEIFSLIGYYAA
jgi:hypothetical protein